MDVTVRLALPLLTAGQAQKEIFHNEALQRIDACVAANVAARATPMPPSAPAAGDSYLVADGATGAWTGQGKALATYGEGGWRFVAAREGLRVWVGDESIEAVYRAGAWEYGVVRGSALIVGGLKVVGEQQGGIAAPLGGSTVDAEARAALSQVIAALAIHGLITP